MAGIYRFHSILLVLNQILSQAHFSTSLLENLKTIFTDKFQL